MPTCPTCGKELNTPQGMRQHHTKVHGERLPNRTCVDCDTDFYHAKAQREFCYNCNPNAGEHNGNWKDAKETAECRLCGEEFEYYPSDKKGVYCPECVAGSDEFLGDAYWEVHDIERVERECEQCGVEMQVLQSHIDYQQSERGITTGRFCSRSCHSDWMSHHWVGEEHHAWKGGAAKYGRSWNSVRQQALERDGFSCQICGKHQDELDRQPDVHHIQPVREFDDYNQAHTVENLISLCRSCHPKVEHKEIAIPELNQPGE